MKFKNFFIAAIFLGASLLPLAASAASILNSDLITAAEKCGLKDAPPCSLNLFVQLGVNVANFILGIVGALTLLMFIYGGITWILSGGSANAVKKGKDIIIGSVVGLLIVFSSYLIINFVVNNVFQATPAFNGSAPKDTAVNNSTSTTPTGANCSSHNGGHCVSSGGCASGEVTIAGSDCNSGQICCAKNDCLQQGGECKPSNVSCTEMGQGTNICATGYHCCQKTQSQQTVCGQPDGVCGTFVQCCNQDFYDYTGCNNAPATFCCKQICP